MFKVTHGEKGMVAVLSLLTDDQEAATLEVNLTNQRARQLSQVLQLAVGPAVLGRDVRHLEEKGA